MASTSTSARWAITTWCGDRVITVEVYTDGMGTYQARCTDCAWRGRWYRTEAKAVEQARTHTEHEPSK